MAEIHPFRAYRYDIERVALEDVLTQPYDKITPAMQEQYYEKSPYNLIAIEKGNILPTDVAVGGKHEALIAAREVRDTPGSLPGYYVVLLGSGGIDIVPYTAQIELFSV